MAIVGTNSTNIAIGAAGGAATLMWAVKSALLEAGWRLMSYGGGTGSGIYQAPDIDGVTAVNDVLTTPDMLNVNGAWFRIKEPGTTTQGREYIMQRGDADTKMHVRYSKATGFTGSDATYPVSEQYSPTTGTGGDGVSLYGSQNFTDNSVRAVNSVVSTNATGFVQAVASDTADANGVWSFYAWSYAAGTATPSNLLYQEGVLNGTAHPLDQDPSYRGFANPRGLIDRGFLNIKDAVTFWWLYGTAQQSYRGYGPISTTNSGTSLCGLGYWVNSQQFNVSNTSLVYPYSYGAGLSVYDDKVDLIPLPIGERAVSNTSGDGTNRFKGISSGIFTLMVTQNLLDVFDITPTKSYIMISTYAANPFHQLAIPWVPNLIPAI